MTTKIIRKTLEEAKDLSFAELDFSDKNLVHLDDMGRMWDMNNITRLTLAHNKLTEIPSSITSLVNLEFLNVFNNDLVDVPELWKLKKLRILNLGMNQLNTFKVPTGSNLFPMLEILDLSYNNLTDETFTEGFFLIESLRALYLSDNELEYLPPQIRQLFNLRILALRDNQLADIPQEIGELSNLRELHLQGNRLQVLPPQIGNMDFLSSRAILKLDNNPWVPPIEDQLVLGVSHVIEYVRSDTYRYLFGRHMQANVPPPEKSERGSKRLTRKNSKASLNGR